MDKHRVYLFQPQYGVDETTYWIPYSVGCIWSYAIQHPEIQENFELKDIVFRRDHPDQVLSKIDNPSICAFSAYMWNARYCLELARLVKKRWPDCLIVFGGPQVNGTFTKYDFIDTILVGEGEENFLEVLRRQLKNQEPLLLYTKKRLENLSGIPSPYTTGVFDQLLANNPDVVWSITLETNRGCPYQCTFCDWGSLTYSKVKKFDLDRVRQDLEWTVNKPINYIFYADANFGIFKERDLEIAKIIREVGDRTNWDAVNLVYAKNSTEVVFQIAKILGDLNRGITISVQSQNADTLDEIKRTNLAINDIRYLMDLSEKYDISTYTEMILGLPYETISSWKKGITEILELGQHNSIDVEFTLLLENSELNSAESRAKHGIKTVIAKDYMPLFNPKDYREISEEFELVRATNTMTTEQMIECYMYGWMVIQFHCTGYSQIMAKEARAQGIFYYDFYNKFFDAVKKDKFFSKHFEEINTIVTRYLQTGTGTESNKEFNVQGLSYRYLYQNLKEAYRLAIEVAEHFGIDDPIISQVQQNFIYERDKCYPIRIGNYELLSKIEGDFDFYRVRRQGSFKNKIVTLEPS
jgi:radical SAM superfamily enzyme YgiQ (UPF0313 family)